MEYYWLYIDDAKYVKCFDEDRAQELKNMGLRIEKIRVRRRKNDERRSNRLVGTRAKRTDRTYRGSFEDSYGRYAFHAENIRHSTEYSGRKDRRGRVY